MKTSETDEISIERLAEIIDVTPRWVRKHIEAGVITRKSRGKVSLKQAVQALIADAKRNADRDQEAAERARLNAARRRVAEARLAEIESRTMEVAEVEAIVDEVCAVVRTEFDTFAGRVAGLDWSLKKGISDESFRSLTRLSEHFAKVATEIENRNRKNKRTNDDD
jgi:phage terminase Nu1 subunit (DNA packaging protein)